MMRAIRGGRSGLWRSFAGSRSYVFVRRLGCPAHDAEDLTRGFLARMIDRGDFGSADQKHGGAATTISIGGVAAEGAEVELNELMELLRR